METQTLQSIFEANELTLENADAQNLRIKGAPHTATLQMLLIPAAGLAYLALSPFLYGLFSQNGFMGIILFVLLFLAALGGLVFPFFIRFSRKVVHLYISKDKNKVEFRPGVFQKEQRLRISEIEHFRIKEASGNTFVNSESESNSWHTLTLLADIRGKSHELFALTTDEPDEVPLLKGFMQSIPKALNVKVI
ncbi:MAG: hypothetical protein HC842_09690 [Cytophagales bacterium]|nr:hypothetical protein [Cytophagales bacterium]